MSINRLKKVKKITAGKQKNKLNSIYGTMMLMALLILPQLSYATPAPTDAPDFVSMWATKDIEGNDNDCSNYISIDSQDNLYMSDYCSGYISKFDANGDPVWRVGSLTIGHSGGNGLFGWPLGMAADSQGSVYVVDMGNHIIQKFDSNGTYLSKLGGNWFGFNDGEFLSPRDIVIDSQDNVFVADSGNSRIQKFDSSGAFVTKFGSEGNGDGQFEDKSLYSIVVDSEDNIYANDSVNKRVQKFASDGTFIAQFGSEGSTCSTTKVPAPVVDDGKFCSVGSLTTDSQGNVYVVDSAYGRIQKFDTNGNYLAQFGSKGNAEGQFSSMGGIAVDSEDNIYIADHDRGIFKFAYADSVTLSNAPSDGSPIPDSITLKSQAGSKITCSSTVTESSIETADNSYDYPLGLLDFCLTVPSGSSQVITVSFITDLTPDQVVPRKYNPDTKQYSYLPPEANASITETVIDGKHALLLTYTVEDNGPLDTAPTLGSIKDPIGLAVLGDSTDNTNTDNNNPITNLANTGQGILGLIVLGIIAIVSGYYITRNKRTRYIAE